MARLTPAKKKALELLSTNDGRINAIAIDQRGVLKKMFAVAGIKSSDESIKRFKQIVSNGLAPYASAILLDPEYGLRAAHTRRQNTGLLLAYEKTGYDTFAPGRIPELLEDWSVLHLKQQGADGIKFLLYYDPDEDPEINRHKQIFMERLGSECAGEDIPFFLQLISYDRNIEDTSSEAYAKVRPHKIIETMREFSGPQYHVDVLQVEVPVNMHYVEGLSTSSVVYSETEASGYFKRQSEVTSLPFVFVSSGSSTQRFQHTLVFAKRSGSTFNGVLCGRATWRNGVSQFIEHGPEASQRWFKTEGKKIVQELGAVITQTASSWREKISL